MRAKVIKWLKVAVAVLFVNTERARRNLKGTLPRGVKREAR